MVLQTRYYIELSDILTAQLECKKCHAVTTRNLSQTIHHLPNVCANCKEEFMPGGSFNLQNLSNLLQAIQDAHKTLANVPFILRFEIVAQQSDSQKSEGQR